MQKDYYVYMIECINGILYTGYTVDVERRFNEHKSGSRGAKFTKAFRPLKITASWRVNGGRGDAMRVEAFIKTLTKNQKLMLAENPATLNRLIKENEKINCSVEVA